MQLNVISQLKTYPVYIETGAFQRLPAFFTKRQRSLIITDDQIPVEYQQQIQALVEDVDIFVVPHGECAKSFAIYQQVMEFMIRNAYDKETILIALGGGVVGDLTGFVAATYKRGIRFIQIPTSTLAMVDSSIGGKVAINCLDVKNCVGNFYPPEAVLIDVAVLKTLPKRHFYAGIIEAFKMGMLFDETLYQMFFEEGWEKQIEAILFRSLQLKKQVVEQDEKEQYLRKSLNYGHTFGHAYESLRLGELYHGEAVALGILTLSQGKNFEQDVRTFFKRIGIPLHLTFDRQEVFQKIQNDKKKTGETVSLIDVETIGHYQIREVPLQALEEYNHG